MDLILSSILFGILGGVVRALVGIAKYFEKNKKDGKLRFGYFAFTLFVAALVGGLAGVLANHDWRLAVIAGYAGTDFLEGLYKIKKRQGFEI
jgi:fluoride ion exporter CrcB/FEX